MRLLAAFGNGAYGRLGLGDSCHSETFPKVLGTLVGYAIKQVSCGGAHTATVAGTCIERAREGRAQLHETCSVVMQIRLR
jgi:hypothetical protein